MSRTKIERNKGQRKPTAELQKPTGLSAEASTAWDRLLTQLEASGISLSQAHSAVLSVCATLTADIRDCWSEISKNGSAYTKAGTGAVKLHPAAARLDALRRDLTKALGLLGLQKPSPEEPEDHEPTLDEILSA